MQKQKVSYSELINLKHEELAKKDPEYYNKINEIIADHPHKPRLGFFESAKKKFFGFLE
ncbi:MAG: hypothetical protein HY392_03890 [Candidatus Diapherotrites archaeon]|nr:hypothetical protein [Candidatus Diapherotrites archaeon]